MDLSQPLSIQDVADFLQAKVLGDSSIEISSINEIHKVKKGSITFVDHEKYYHQVIYSAASVIIIDKEMEFPKGTALLVVDDPFDAYNRLAKQQHPGSTLNEGISPAAYISDTAQVGKNTIIEPHVVIGNHVKIGDNCLIRANTTIGDYTEIGNNTIIHANCAIGNDAFYFKTHGYDGHERWHTIGRVVIQNDVEIGAGCTIDRGVSGDTIIGLGSKLDNLVHIAHGVVIGKHCLLAAQVGIAGKTVIQDNVTIYGQSGISKALVIGERAVILAKSGVSKSLPGGNKYFGAPAAEARQRFRELAALRSLPEFMRTSKNNKVPFTYEEEDEIEQ